MFKLIAQNKRKRKLEVTDDTLKKNVLLLLTESTNRCELQKQKKTFTSSNIQV